MPVLLGQSEIPHGVARDQSRSRMVRRWWIPTWVLGEWTWLSGAWIFVNFSSRL